MTIIITILISMRRSIARFARVDVVSMVNTIAKATPATTAISFPPEKKGLGI